MSAVVCIEDCRTRPYMDPALWSTDSHLDVDLLVRGFHGSVAICKSPRRGFQNYWSTVTKTTCVFVCVLLSSMKTKGLLVLPNQRLWSDPALPANKNGPASGRAIQAVISRACQSRGDGIARRGADDTVMSLDWTQSRPSPPAAIFAKNVSHRCPSAPCLSAPYLRAAWTLSSRGLKGCQGTPAAVSPAHLQIPLSLDAIELICQT